MRLKWKREPVSDRRPLQGDGAGEQHQYRLRRGDLTVAVVAPCLGGWFFRSEDGRVNTLAERPPRTWADADEARRAAREWAQVEDAERAGAEA